MPGRPSGHRGREWLRAAAGSAAAIACAWAATAASADIGSAPDAGTWVTDGPVYSIARAGDRTFIGGEFSHVGPRTGSGVPLAPLGDPAAGKPTPGLGSFPEVFGGQVRAAVAGTDGSWYIGGDFTHVGGTARGGLARLIRDPSDPSRLIVDPGFDPRPNGSIHALALGVIAGKDDHVLYIGGDFSGLGGDIAYNNFAAVDEVSGAPVGLWPAPDGAVTAIDVLRQDSTGTAYPVVFIGGPFTKVGPDGRGELAALWGVGAGAQEGNVTDWGPGIPPGLRALHVEQARANAAATAVGSAVYIGGSGGLTSLKFTITTATGAIGPGTIHANVPAFTCEDAACAVSVDALETSQDGNTLYVGGRFTKVGAEPRRNLAALSGAPDAHNAAPALTVRAWKPEPDRAVRALALSEPPAPAAVYAGGDFTQVLETSRGGLVALSPSGSTAAAGPNDATLLEWNPGTAGGVPGPAAGVVTALDAAPTAVYAGGSFTSIGPSRRDNVAALDSAGNLVDGWAPSADGPVHALAAGNGRVYLGGRFENVSGAPRQRLAAVAASDGTLDAAFLPAVDPTCVGAACSSGVLSLALSDQTLYVGGAFASLAGASRANAGSVDALSGAILPWAPEPDGNVYSLLATCGTVYAGGAFATAGGQPRSRLAALDPATGAAHDWNPSVESGAVYALARDAETVYAGGTFAKAGGTERKRVAALDAATGLATAWNAQISGTGDVVRALAVPPGGSTVYLGGRFTTAGGANRANLAAIDRSNGSALDWNPGSDGDVRALVSDGVSLLAGGEFRSLADRTQQGFGSFGLGTGAGATALTCKAPEPPPPEPVVEEPLPPPPPPPPPPVEPQRDSLAPQLSGLGLTKKRFRTARRRIGASSGTAFEYTLSEPSVVHFAFKRRTRVRCSSAEAKRPCYRWRSAGALGHLSRAGEVKLRFAGRVGIRWLRPGRYRVRTWAVDAAGNRSTASRLGFVVLPERG